MKTLRILLMIVLAAGLHAEKRRVTPDDGARIASVSDPQISPDGRSIACVVSRPNAKENRSEDELVLVDVATGAQRTLTYDRRHVASPRWSPNGDRLAFIGFVKDAPQIFVLPMNGGEALQVTSTKSGVQQFAWRPDGKSFAFVASDEKPERKDRAKFEDAFEPGNIDYLAQELPTSSHVWTIDADGGNAKQITKGAWSIPTAEPPGPVPSPLSWSADGKLLAITKQETPVYGDSDRTSVQILDVASGNTRALTKQTKFATTPEFSPDGSKVAYWYPRDGDPNNEVEIYVAQWGADVSSAHDDPSGRDVRSPQVIDATRAIDRSIFRALWMPDGKSLIVGGHDATSVALWLQPLNGAPQRLDLGEISPSWSFWVDMNVGRDGAIAFTGSEPQHPKELYYMSSATAKPRRLTSLNDAIASELDLGQVERVTWTNDGYNEDGVVVYPPDFRPDRKYPLVLLIHGGPQAASTRTFSLLPQVLAAQGWVVFSPNYRGSDNLGNTYEHAITADAGAGPMRDVMAGVAMLEKRGFIDHDRMAVSGWSYGGYMTSWMIGHTNVFKAAVSGAAVNNLSHEYALSDNSITSGYQFGGSPYVSKFAKLYIEQSPITYASAIKTPTLILTDTGDTRVPATQSFEMYHALKDNGVEVKFVAYPVGGHFPGDPVRSADVSRRWVDWIKEHFK